MELIPGLPNDVALECLIRISFDQFPKAASVCRAWNGVIKQPEFLRLRKASGLSRPFIAMVESKDVLWGNRPVYRLMLFDPVKGRCYDVPPPILETGEGLPINCCVFGIGPELLTVIGGDWGKGRFVNSVFIYNFLSGRRRRGAGMPGEERLFYGCAASEEGTVVVAGGIDLEINSLKTTLAYDVARDRWASLPDMSYGREECTCVFHRGKFHVVGSYEVEANEITETLDLVTGQWRLGDTISEVATLLQSNEATYLEICGVIYIVSAKKDVIALEDDSTWVVIARVPDEIRNVAYVTGWQGKMMVFGSGRAYMLEVKTKKWSKVEIPSQHCDRVLSCCCIDL
nr:F-box/kelch-repeat protein At1g80440-like [Ipomoea batatas]